jgi:hypothetical protein
MAAGMYQAAGMAIEALVFDLEARLQNEVADQVLDLEGQQRAKKKCGGMAGHVIPLCPPSYRIFAAATAGP